MSRDKVKLLQEEVYILREKCNALYSQRNMLIALLTKMAIRLGLPTGWREHEKNGEEWPKESQRVVYIYLPSGQTSFHCPLRDEVLFTHLGPFESAWDGHTDEVKWHRINNPNLDKL